MKRCVYCGKKIQDCNALEAYANPCGFAVCSSECKEKTELYIKKDKKFKQYLYLVILIATMNILSAVFFDTSMKTVYLFHFVVGAAFLCFPYPFVMFESFKSCSIHKVITLCRVLGIAFMVWTCILIIFL